MMLTFTEDNCITEAVISSGTNFTSGPQWCDFFATSTCTAKFQVNSACVTWYTKSSLHSLSGLEIVHKSRNNHDDIIDVIPLSLQHTWQS